MVQISGVVGEQELGLRQMLTTMGMLDSAYWLSWMLFEVCSACHCLNPKPLLLLLSLLLHFHHVYCLCFLWSNFATLGLSFWPLGTWNALVYIFKLSWAVLLCWSAQCSAPHMAW